MDSSRASAFSGIVSIGLWVIVYSPQIWLNYREKTGEGLSLAFIAIWLAGKLLSPPAERDAARPISWSSSLVIFRGCNKSRWRNLAILAAHNEHSRRLVHIL